MKKQILKTLRAELVGIMPDNHIRKICDDIMAIVEDTAEGFKESLRAEIEHSEECQEQGQRPKYNQGKIEASEYAIEMISKHINMD